MLDEDLARELGYSEARLIRRTIKSNLDELEGYGPLACRSRTQLRANGSTHYVDAYYLNEEQALLLCMFSGAEKAKEIRRQIITVFQAWRKGKLQPTMPDFNDPIALAYGIPRKLLHRFGQHADGRRFIASCDVARTVTSNGVSQAFVNASA